MTPTDINKILLELAHVLEQLGVVQKGQARLEGKLDYTNGKVAELVADKIAREAIEAERARAHAEAQATDDDMRTERYQAASRRDQIRNVFLGAILTLIVGVIVAFAADLHPFS